MKTFEKHGTEVAKTILEQLGGNRFLAMTGSEPCNTKNGLLLILKMTKVSKYLNITLNAEDTYDLTFYNIDGKTFETKVKKEFKGIYAEDLQEIFSETTGLAVRL